MTGTHPETITAGYSRPNWRSGIQAVFVYWHVIWNPGGAGAVPIERSGLTFTARAARYATYREAADLLGLGNDQLAFDTVADLVTLTERARTR